ncbi:MAG: tetratricopeptide repeat protein [Rhodospirillales bacterium]
MQEATDATVLGNFDGATFNDGVVTSRFFRRDGGFFVNTDGPVGHLADFAIRYTFGVYPLQQYLIAFPDGRLQALGIAWDSRPKEEGGQRWFQLYPDQTPRAGNPLHWTGLDQTWNFQCAECHSTELRKNYDAARNTYATTWAELNVACEACHGPGSAHVAWARGGGKDGGGTGGTPASGNGLTVHFDERRDVQWLPDSGTGTARRSVPHRAAAELETCGVCHSLSTKIAEPWRPGHPLLDSHLPALLVPGSFEADGKNLGETYNYAAFRQSKMFSRGVTCSDCHDPHSLKLRAEGNAVCEQCHDPEKFSTAAHTHHPEGSPAGQCVACHMPARTFMGVDRRHDHGFRIPRPDESVRFGTSNTCNDCHTDKNAAWAAAAIEKWFGPQRKGFQTWTAPLAAARDGSSAAPAALARLAADPETPSIVRATAFAAMSPTPDPATFNAVRAGTGDADPLVRWSALRALSVLPDTQSRPLAAARLADPVLGVRIEAARQLAAVSRDGLPEADRSRLDKATGELIEALRVNADRPESRVNLGQVYARQGRLPDAIAEFAAARALDPGFTPAYVEGAQALAQQGKEADGEQLMREGLARAPADAILNHALGLSLIRQRRAPEALGFLESAAKGDPSSPRFAFVYAIALNALGQPDAALEVLGASHARHSGDADTLLALATINRDAGRRAAALEWARKLAAFDPRGRSLVDELSRTPSR